LGQGKRRNQKSKRCREGGNEKRKVCRGTKPKSARVDSTLIWRKGTKLERSLTGEGTEKWEEDEGLF